VIRYPISVWERAISIRSSPISLAHIPYRYPGCHIDMVDNHIDIPYPKSIPHIPYPYSHRNPIDVRSPISISHIDLSCRYRIMSCHSDDVACNTRRALLHGVIRCESRREASGCGQSFRCVRSLGRGGIENKHSTDVQSTKRVRAWYVSTSIHPEGKSCYYVARLISGQVLVLNDPAPRQLRSLPATL